MNNLSPKLSPLLDGLPANVRADLATAIETSPYLVQTLQDVAEQGRVKRIAFTSKPFEGGHYDADSKTIFLSNDLLHEKNTQARIDNFTATIGHEAGHAYFAGHLDQALSRLDFEINDSLQAAGPGGRADLTAPFERYLLATREGEALAEIGGMNALASRIRAQNDGVFDRADFLKRADATTDCISPGKGGAPTFARDIRIRDDGRIYAGSIPLVSDRHNANPNREAVALCHFDQKPNEANLGRQGKSDYQNYYAPRAFGAAARELQGWNNPPEVSIDLARLKVDPALMERNGLDLGGGNKSFGFLDASHGAMKWTMLHHTKAAPSNTTPEVVPPRADQPGHADYPAFERIRSAVQADGRWGDAQCHNLAAAVLAAQKADPVCRQVDGVAIGRDTGLGVQVFAYSSPHGPQGPHHPVGVDAQVGANTPAVTNLDRVEQINQQQAQAQAQQLEAQQRQSGPGWVK